MIRNSLLGKWLPVFLWAALIFYFSSMPDLRSDFPNDLDFVLVNKTRPNPKRLAAYIAQQADFVEPDIENFGNINSAVTPIGADLVRLFVQTLCLKMNSASIIMRSIMSTLTKSMR